jgi:hypothetical protein
MKVSQGIGLAALTLGMVIGLACGHQSSVPIVASGAITPADGARLPFDREAQNGGISPTNSVVPPGAQAPAGTAIVIRLRKPLSSARAHSNDSFAAELDEPLVVNDHVLAMPGSLVTGRVVEAKSISRMHTPGYMRLTLSSISIDGKPARVRTSSTFLKGMGPRKRMASLPPSDGEGALLGAASTGTGPVLGDAMLEQDEQNPPEEIRLREAMVGPERRLKFRLIEPLPIHP